MSAIPESPLKAGSMHMPPQPVDRGPESKARPKLETYGLDFYYGKFHALHNINLQVPEKRITALIGPSGCGKSTFLRTLNRINDTIKTAHYDGKVMLDGQDVRDFDVTDLRRRVGMVF